MKFIVLYLTLTAVTPGVHFKDARSLEKHRKTEKVYLRTDQINEIDGDVANYYYHDQLKVWFEVDYCKIVVDNDLISYVEESCDDFAQRYNGIIGNESKPSHKKH